MYVRAFFISLFFLFSLSFAIESLKNKDFHPNYKKTTLNQKVQQMEALELQFPKQLNDNPMKFIRIVIRVRFYFHNRIENQLQMIRISPHQTLLLNIP